MGEESSPPSHEPGHARGSSIELDPKLALITGATGGIGRATALALARAGYRLALHYHSAPAEAREELVTSAVAAYAGPRRGVEDGVEKKADADADTRALVSIQQADLAEPDGAEGLWRWTVGHFRAAPGVLVLNAGSTGGISRPADVGAVPPEVFERTWRVNTLAPYALARLAVPHMAGAGFGRVVFTSSVAGMTGGVVGPHYASSKAALHGLVHWLAGNVARSGVTVNAVAPALIEDTAMLPGGNDELRRLVPVGRLGRPEEVAHTIMWMVQNGYVTNKVIAVDGGMAVQ